MKKGCCFFGFFFLGRFVFIRSSYRWIEPYWHSVGWRVLESSPLLTGYRDLSVWSVAMIGQCWLLFDCYVHTAYGRHRRQFQMYAPVAGDTSTCDCSKRVPVRVTRNNCVPFFDLDSMWCLQVVKTVRKDTWCTCCFHFFHPHVPTVRGNQKEKSQIIDNIEIIWLSTYPTDKIGKGKRRNSQQGVYGDTNSCARYCW